MSERRRRIADSFGEAVERYDAGAGVQARVAGALAARVRAETLPSGPRVLEVGCGTGLFSRLLVEAVPEGRFLLTDLSPRMLAACEARVVHSRADFRVVDGEAPDLAPGQFDLIVSSFALQWFEDLAQGLERIVRLLRPGGILWFATLGARTFTEWRAAHEALGLPCGTPTYPSASGFPWPQGGTAHLEVRAHVEHPPDARAFLRSLRGIGADVPAPGHVPLGGGALRRVMRRFDETGRVTWEVLLGRFQRNPEAE